MLLETEISSRKEVLEKIFIKIIVFKNTNMKSICIKQVINLKELLVHCVDKMISVLEVQQEGKKRLSIQDFLKGSNIKNGDHFS